MKVWILMAAGAVLGLAGSASADIFINDITMDGDCADFADVAPEADIEGTSVDTPPEVDDAAGHVSVGDPCPQ
jgi:hypothetical protein